MNRAPHVPLITTMSKLLAAARFEERFGILRELMVALDIAPVSGRVDARNNILLVLRAESLRLESPIAAADLVSLSNAMTELEHEAGRCAPTPGLFNRTVGIAIRALRRTISVSPSIQGPGLGTRPAVAGEATGPLVPPARRLHAVQRTVHRLDTSSPRATGTSGLRWFVPGEQRHDTR